MMKTLILLLVISVVFAAEYRYSRRSYEPVVHTDYGVRSSRGFIDRHDLPPVRSERRRGGRRSGRRGGRRHDTFDRFRDHGSRRSSHSRRVGGRWNDHFD